jgi:hypothetical protein
LFSSNGDIYSKTTSDKDFSLLSNSEKKIVVSSTALVDDGKIATMASDNIIGILDPKKKSYDPQTVSLTYAGIINNFSSTLYVLDPPQNQIHKINSDNGAYSKATDYLKDGSIISDSVDMAIDGSVYLLAADGKIGKFSRGKKAGDISFTMPASEKISGYKRIFASDTQDDMFLFSDSGGLARLIEIDKTGKFIGQFQLDGADGAQDIAVDLPGRTTYILKGSQVSSFKF